MVENGHRKPTRKFVEAVDSALKLDDALIGLYDMTDAMGGRLPEWFRPWVEIEREAKVLRTWQPLVVPGLLQTEEYARIMLSGEPGVTPAQLDENVAARIDRRGILSRANPPILWVVLDERVLRHPVGSEDVMARQIEHLAEAAQQPNITVQVVPLNSGATTGLSGGFVLAEIPGMADVAYMDSAQHGQVTDRTEEVATLSYRYEVIRAEALTKRASLKLIEEMVQ